MSVVLRLRNYTALITWMSARASCLDAMLCPFSWEAESWPLKDVQVPIPRTCTMTNAWQMGFCCSDYIEDFEMGRLSWIIWHQWVDLKGALQEGSRMVRVREGDVRMKEEVRVMPLLTWRQRKRPQAKDCGQPLEAGKWQGNLFPPRASGRNPALLTPCF